MTQYVFQAIRQYSTVGLILFLKMGQSSIIVQYISSLYKWRILDSVSTVNTVLCIGHFISTLGISDLVPPSGEGTSQQIKEKEIMTSESNLKAIKSLTYWGLDSLRSQIHTHVRKSGRVKPMEMRCCVDLIVPLFKRTSPGVETKPGVFVQFNFKGCELHQKNTVWMQN